MYTFTTESGSVYEVDHEAKRCRKVSGTATGRTTIGEWRNYLWLVMLPSQRMLIGWAGDTPLLAPPPEGYAGLPCTETTRVIAFTRP